MLIIVEKDKTKSQKKENRTEEFTDMVIKNMMENMIYPNNCKAREKRLEKETEMILKKKDEIKKTSD